MDASLHDPTWGYYARHVSIGRGGHFITNPESLSPRYGQWIATWAFRCWRDMVAHGELAEADPFPIVEFGAGNGRLARDVLDAVARTDDELWRVFASRVQYRIYETSAVAARQAAPAPRQRRHCRRGRRATPRRGPEKGLPRRVARLRGHERGPRRVRRPQGGADARWRGAGGAGGAARGIRRTRCRRHRSLAVGRRGEQGRPPDVRPPREPGRLLPGRGHVGRGDGGRRGATTREAGRPPHLVTLVRGSLRAGRRRSRAGRASRRRRRRIRHRPRRGGVGRRSVRERPRRPLHTRARIVARGRVRRHHRLRRHHQGPDRRGSPGRVPLPRLRRPAGLRPAAQ